MAAISDGRYDQVGTFNGNPLTMAAAKVNLTEVLTKPAYERLDELNTILHHCEDVIAKYRLPASMKTLGAKGSIDWSTTPIHEYRDLWKIDDRVPQLAWLWQLNRGVFKSPGSKWESWTTSIVMSDADAERYVGNFESFAAHQARRSSSVALAPWFNTTKARIASSYSKLCRFRTPRTNAAWAGPVSDVGNEMRPSWGAWADRFQAPTDSSSVSAIFRSRASFIVSCSQALG